MLCSKHHAKLRQNAEIHFPGSVKSLPQIREKQFQCLCWGQYVEWVNTLLD